MLKNLITWTPLFDILCLSTVIYEVFSSLLNWKSFISLIFFSDLLRTLTSKEKFVILKGYTTLVRPHLEYCTPVWAPLPEHGCWGTILNIESIQRLATKSFSGLKDFSYNAR